MSKGQLFEKQQDNTYNVYGVIFYENDKNKIIPDD
jgi:hypothetical protein